MLHFWPNAELDVQLFGFYFTPPLFPIDLGKIVKSTNRKILGVKEMGDGCTGLCLTKFISHISKLLSRSVQNSYMQLGYSCILTQII